MSRYRAVRVVGVALAVAASVVGVFCFVRRLPEERAAAPAAAKTTLRGVVESDAGPLAGAVVRFKGSGESTLTDERGRFELSRPAWRSNHDLIVTASQPGFFIGSVAADSTALRIQLARLPAEDNENYRWVDPTPDANASHQCGNCHREMFDEWQASGHATAATNRRFLNLYDGTDWHGRPGVGASLLADHPNGAGVCVSCHAPGLNLDDPAAIDIRKIRGVDALGVHCDFCHKVRDVSTDSVGLTHGRFGMQLLRPREGQLFFGPLDDVDRGEDAFSPVQRESRYCAACHEGVVFGVHVYSTYSEWLASPAARDGRTCQSCHMTPTGRMTNIAPGSGGIERDPRTLASHSFLPGGRDAMLKRALDVHVAIQRATDETNGATAIVRITPHDVGHRVPTGFIDRHLVLVVEPLDAQARPLAAESELVLPPAAGQDFAGKPGRLFARLLTDQDGRGPVPFWQATPDPLDTRLRPDEPVTTEFRLPAATRSVRTRLLYRRFWPATSQEKSWPDDTLTIFDETRAVAME